MLSALRLCVWLLDHRNIPLCDMDQGLLFTLRAKQWEIPNLRIFPDFDSRLAAA